MILCSLGSYANFWSSTAGIGAISTGISRQLLDYTDNCNQQTSYSDIEFSVRSRIGLIPDLY